MLAEGGLMEDPSTLRRLKHTLTKENLWLYIFSVLKTKGKVYAYGLGSELERKFGWRHGLITSYVVLYRLEAEGLISSEYESRRKYYRLTPKGRKALAGAKSYMKSLAGRL
mgnify:CR=1 FL=1